MKLSKIFLRATLASIGMLAATAAALAVPVAATTGVNVRSGPGTEFDVLDTLTAGELADAVECIQSGWCRVIHNGPTGWVYNTYLGPRPNQNNNSGNAANPANPAQQQNTQVGACFFTGQGHTGDKTCSGVGTFNTLGNFDNRIRSYQVFGGAHVNFCVNSNMSGSCFEGSRSTPTLGPPLDGKASSLSIFTVGTANNNGGGFGNQNNNQGNNNNNQGNQQANTQNTPDDPDCSFGLVLGPDGPTFSLTCGDNAVLVDPNSGNGQNNGQANNNNDPVADAADRFGDNENLVVIGEGEEENDNVLQREPQVLIQDDDNILGDLGFGDQNNGQVGTPGQQDALVDTPAGPLVFDILQPLNLENIFRQPQNDDETPPILGSGSIDLGFGSTLNFENGRSHGPGQDIKYSIFELNRSFETTNNAKFSQFFDNPQGFAGCNSVAKSREAVQFFRNATEYWFCVLTDENNLVEVHVVPPNGDNAFFEYTTWGL